MNNARITALMQALSEAIWSLDHHGHRVEARRARAVLLQREVKLMTETDETYLGDGLYASFDGHHFKLRAPRFSGDHWVALEPATLAAFDAFRAEITTAIAQQQISDSLGKFKFNEDE